MSGKMIVGLCQCRKTHVVNFDNAKHFIIPTETLFFKDLPYLLIRQQKLWILLNIESVPYWKKKKKKKNDMSLRIATVTRFIWYFAANTTVL